MVFSLFPVDPQSGENKYYIFANGSYKMGRKGCDIIITKDKGVSRVHSEIFVDAMNPSDSSRKSKSSSRSLKVRIRDCSKYGTFIKRNSGSVEKLHELPNKEASLIDGNLISFGTGNATYKFSFVPLVIWVCPIETYQVNHPLQDKILSIGAQVTYSFSQECTHVLVDEFTVVREDFLDAIAAKKPCINSNWVTSVAGENICTAFPNFSLQTPSVTVDGRAVKLADPITREGCLERFTFVLDSINNYKFSNQLKPLMDISGAKVLSIEGFISHNRKSDTESNEYNVCVIPGGSATELGCFTKLSSLSRIKEMDLICAVLAGKLDRSVLISPCVVVSSSCSTDETVVADSEAEDATATSARDTMFASHSSVEIMETVSKVDTTDNFAVSVVQVTETVKKSKQTDEHTVTDHIESFRSSERAVESGSENLDIIYSQRLKVRGLRPSTVRCTANNEGVNFKRFRKKNTESGNSFGNLVPFSRYPYTESNESNEDIAKSMKEEKKRKQMETMAEDLFNYEKGRKQAASGVLRSLFAKAKR